MRLDQELVRRGLCESRQEAQECIDRGDVLVDGIGVFKKTKQVSEGNVIELLKGRKFVSRGGEKLEGELLSIYGNEDTIREKLSGKIALDIGSSTGGFTDCLLSYGVIHSTCVDVGTLQLHEKLRNDSRVSLFENTDIRNFQSQEKYGVVVADLSFIALEKIINTILSFGSDTTLFFLLIKPQFEVGSGNTKKGIVKDQLLIDEVLSKYKNLLKNFCNEVTITPCVLKGGDGNQEYFLSCTKLTM